MWGKPTFQDKAHCVCLSKIRSEYESHTAQDWTDRLLLHYNFVCWSLQTVSVCMLKTHRYTIWKKYFANTLLFVCMNDNKPPRGHVPMNDYVMTSCTNVCSILHKSVICLLDTQVGCSIKRCFFCSRYHSSVLIVTLVVEWSTKAMKNRIFSLGTLDRFFKMLANLPQRQILC